MTERHRPHPSPTPAVLVALGLSVCSAAAARPLVRAQGWVDNTYIQCGAAKVNMGVVGASMRLTLDCGTGEPITCTPRGTGLRYSREVLDFDCQSIQPAGAFRAALLPAAATIQPGGAAIFTVQVYNSLTQPLANVSVTAPQAPGCSASRASLAAGGAWQYTCSTAALTRDASITLAVSATRQDGSLMQAQARAQVLLAAGRLDLRVTPAAQNLPSASGGTAYWTVELANYGTDALTNLMEIDDLGMGSTCVFGPASLASYTAVSFPCRKTAITHDLTATHTAQALAGTWQQGVTRRVAVTVGQYIFASGFETPTLFADGFERGH